MTDTVDVEACVRLLNGYADVLEGRALLGPATMAIRENEAAMFRALASALPGMGRACDLLREAAEFADHAGACRMNNYYPGDTCTCGYDEWRESAARAAQPQETSADA